MRDDVAERYTEPYNGYTNWCKYPRTNKKFKKTDEDGHPVENPKKAYTLAGIQEGSWPGEDYKFLRRVLMGNVGRPWDEVYSEICEQADSRNFIGHRIREAIDTLVEKNCYIDEDGVVRDDHDYKVGGMFWRPVLFVHPETGLLEKMDCRRRYRKEKPPQTVFFMEGHRYHKHDGIWYRVEMEHVSKANNYWGYRTYNLYGVNDAFKAHIDPGPPKGARYHYFSINDSLYKKYGYDNGNLWYCKKKEQASKGEIKALKKKYKLD